MVNIKNHINDIANNPFAIEKYNKEQLYDILQGLDIIISELIFDNDTDKEFYLKTWNVIKKIPNETFEQWLYNHSNEYKKYKDVFDIVNNRLNDLTNNDKDLNEPELNTGLNKRMDIKVSLLYEYGVIEHLIKKGLSQNNIATLVEYLTNDKVTRNSVNKNLSDIHNFGIKNELKPQIESIKISLGLVKK